MSGGRGWNKSKFKRAGEFKKDKKKLDKNAIIAV